MAETNRVDLEQPNANMYGCTPCPDCGGKFRVPYQDGRIECCDCDFTERAAPTMGDKDV
jgi:hypothetical protein